MSNKVPSLVEVCKVNAATVSYDLFYRDVNEVDVFQMWGLGKQL